MHMKYKVKLGLTLFGIGFLGILTMLTVTLPFDHLPPEVLEIFSPQELQLLSLINPIILLLIAVVVGTILFDKVKLSVPTISSLFRKGEAPIAFLEQTKYGVILGLLTGLLSLVISIIFSSLSPHEFALLGENIDLTLIARIGYGGFTEELLMRFGLMTLVVWIVYKINKKLTPFTYWTGIIIATLIFAIGHFPLAYSTITHPTVTLLAYILIGNSIAGIFFGWLYWKKGLEAAIIGHIFTHLAMVIGGVFLSL